MGRWRKGQTVISLTLHLQKTTWINKNYQRRLLASQSAPAGFAQQWHFLHQEGNSSSLKLLEQTINSWLYLRTNNTQPKIPVQPTARSAALSLTAHTAILKVAVTLWKFCSCQWWSFLPSKGGKQTLNLSLITELLLSKWVQSQHTFPALRSRIDIQFSKLNLKTGFNQHKITPYTHVVQQIATGTYNFLLSSHSRQQLQQNPTEHKLGARCLATAATSS